MSFTVVSTPPPPRVSHLGPSPELQLLHIPDKHGYICFSGEKLSVGIHQLSSALILVT